MTNRNWNFSSIRSELPNSSPKGPKMVTHCIIILRAVSVMRAHGTKFLVNYLRYINFGFDNIRLQAFTKTDPVTHSSDVIMRAMASQITGVSIVCSTVCSGADQRKHQTSVSLAFVTGIHRWAVNSHQKGPVRRKMFPFDDVIMRTSRTSYKLFRTTNISAADGYVNTI